MSDITFAHPDIEKWNRRAKLVIDVLNSDVKEAGDVYLPRPNETDTSLKNQKRFEAYNKRAIFVNYTARTHKGMIGAAFTKAPKCDVPAAMDYVKTNIDGAGISIYQQSQKVLGYVLAVGRCALFVDYPKSEGLQTQAQKLALNIRARTVMVKPESILYWRTAMIGGLLKLSRFTFWSNAVEESEFGEKVIEQIICLRLEIIDDPDQEEIRLGKTHKFKIEFWRKRQNGENAIEWHVFDEYYPLDGSGKYWQEIPLTFVGSENNDASLDYMPMYDMAEVNVGHYRNSADYEDSVYMCGQPQFWASGIDEDYYRFLEKEGVMVGSRSLFPVPEGGSMGIAQAQPNTLCKEAMSDKQQQIVAIGARIITQGSVAKTATESESDDSAEHSVLSLCASNASEAYVKCLNWMAQYDKIEAPEIEFEISQEFTRARADAQMLSAFTQLLNTGYWPVTDFFRAMKKIDMIDPEKSDDDILEELASAAPTPPLNDLMDGTDPVDQQQQDAQGQ